MKDYYKKHSEKFVTSTIEDFKEVFDFALMSMENDQLSASTFNQFYYSVNRFHSYLIENGITSIQNITKPLLTKYINLIETLDLKNSTKNKLRQELKKFMTYCFELQKVDIRVIPKIKKLSEHDSKTDYYVIQKEDVIKLLKTLFQDERTKFKDLKKEVSDLFLILVGLNFGCRISEIAQIKLKDFNLRDNTLTIMQNKTKRKRICFLNQTLLFFFHQHYILNIEDSNQDNPFIFSNDNGATHTESRTLAKRITYRFKKINPNLELRSHDLRRFYITNGITETSVAEMFSTGVHQDIRSLLRYYHTNIDKKREISKKVQILENLS